MKPEQMQTKVAVTDLLQPPVGLVPRSLGWTPYINKQMEALTFCV